MNIDVTPFPKLTISVERQVQIVEGINRALAINPRQSFCLTGQPGSGKTYIMKRLRDAAQCDKRTLAFVGDVITLGEWHAKNRAHVMSNEQDGMVFESAENIQHLAKINKQIDKSNVFDMQHCTSRFGVTLRRMHSYHFYLDEFDCQPSYTDFTQGNFQMFMNRVYEHTGRKRAGNVSDYVQFVCAMNKSMDEFKNTSSLHIYRRVLEMCTVVDFDKATITAPVVAAPEQGNRVDIANNRKIDEICGLGGM